MKKMNNQTKIGKVVLNVENLTVMSAFYQEIIGLEVKSQSVNEVNLGAHDGTATVLFTLVKVPETVKQSRTTGLYHTAFLLSERKDLGDSLYHLLKTKYPVTGASDHGYSEAVYLDDPEGNGIEIYRDKPRSFWDINPDGTINGITIEMDAEGVIGEATGSFSGMPAGTTVGHIHLTVADLDQTSAFYVNMLGLNLQTEFPGQAKFIAAGDYHHHIGANVWSGKNIPAMEKETKGLNFFTLAVPSVSDLADVKDNLREKGYAYEYDAEKAQIKLEDPNGIELVIEVQA